MDTVVKLARCVYLHVPKTNQSLLGLSPPSCPDASVSVLFGIIDLKPPAAHGLA